MESPSTTAEAIAQERAEKAAMTEAYETKKPQKSSLPSHVAAALKMEQHRIR
jgi:hypothetical protein